MLLQKRLIGERKPFGMAPGRYWRTYLDAETGWGILFLYLLGVFCSGAGHLRRLLSEGLRGFVGVAHA